MEFKKAATVNDEDNTALVVVIITLLKPGWKNKGYHPLLLSNENTHLLDLLYILILLALGLKIIK